MKIKLRGFKILNGLKESEGIELKERVDALTRYFFGGFGAKIVTIEGILTFIRDSKSTEGDREGIGKSFAWVKRKYEQIPFSDLRNSPYYDDYKPLFAINEILPELAKNIELALSEGGKYCDIAVEQLNKIHELGREYTKTTEKYYKELTGQSLREADVKTRALMEYRTKEQILDQARWLQEQDIKPNSFEKAAMSYYGVSVK